MYTKPTLTPQEAVARPEAGKKLQKKLRKLCEQPEARLITVTANGNLCITTQKELIVEHFILVTRRGLFAKWGEVAWQPEEQNVQLPLEVGIVTETNCFIRLMEEDLPGIFLNEKAPPANDDVVLLFIWTSRFVELFAITPSTEQVFRLLRPMREGTLLRGVCLDLLKAYRPAEYQQLSDFLKEVAPHV